MTATNSSDAAEPAPSAPEDAKAKFRAALEAKRAGAHPSVRGGKRGKLAGHEHDSAHQQKVFRRKSG